MLELIIPALLAGIITFLTPCTLPLVPGFLGFISGVSLHDLEKHKNSASLKRKIFYNGLLYVAGFSVIFIIMGSLAGLGGSALLQYRLSLARVGGVVIIIFGVWMLHVIDFPFLNFLKKDKRSQLFSGLKPGKHLSSFLFGAIFALGWTPCVGPILGSVILLASTTSTLTQGAFLLSVFSLGFGLPFLIIAAIISYAPKIINVLMRLTKPISFIAGLFLIIIGILLITNSFDSWARFFNSLFDFINYDCIYNIL